MAPAPAPERVRIWNSFFKLAWIEANSVFEMASGTKSSKAFSPLGGTLPDQEFHVLALLVLCSLAIEARANHLIEELQEQGKVSPDLAWAAKRLPPKHKWFLLPTIAGVRKTLDAGRLPHQAIAQICTLRNNLMHVDYATLRSKLPNPNMALSWFTAFVEAMEDMNVVLGRVRRARKTVRALGRFP